MNTKELSEWDGDQQDPLMNCFFRTFHLPKQPVRSTIRHVQLQQEKRISREKATQHCYLDSQDVYSLAQFGQIIRRRENRSPRDDAAVHYRSFFCPRDQLRGVDALEV